MDRFMVLHISMESIKPEKPFGVPAMSRTLLEMAKPVAAAASPA
jgi:hypothetical protein